MGTTDPSRRGLLGAITLAPIAAVASATLPDAGAGADWRRLLAAYRASERSFADFNRDEFDPARSAWLKREAVRKEVLQALIDDLPHYETVATYETIENARRSMSTANEVHVALTKTFMNKPAPWSAVRDDFGTCCVELHAAMQKRNAAIGSLKEASPEERFSPKLEAEHLRLSGLCNESFAALRDFKPASLRDLIAQITFFEEEGFEIDHGNLLTALSCISVEGRA